MRLSPCSNGLLHGAISICVLAMVFALPAAPQEPKMRLEKPAALAAPESPFTIEKLETRVRFEADGASRREVHTVIKIHTEAGARQFARLNFDYNRGFEQIEIPLLRIVHANGGTTEILPSAIADQPNPAVVDAPAYHDVRRKSARILGLAAGDTLEYRVVTTVSHHPLAPDFWLTHSFARSGTVVQETYELDLPASRQVQIRINRQTPAVTETTGDGPDARVIYRWQRPRTENELTASQPDPAEPDFVLTTFESWRQLAGALSSLFQFRPQIPPQIVAKGDELTRNEATTEAMLRAVYEFVSQEIRTVDLPLGATGFKTRSPLEILSSGYGTAEDKQVLFASLAKEIEGSPIAALVPKTSVDEMTELPFPGVFAHVLTVESPRARWWMDLNTEVAPYRMIPSTFRGKRVFMANADLINVWHTVPLELPFGASQKVDVDASLANSGKLTAHVKYALRGDSELLLRMAFRRAPREQWKGLAQLLSLSDGFRGVVSNVAASDPTATREPFTIQYDIAQPNFVNWSKPPVRLPIPLPTLGLPEASARMTPSDSQTIDLGSPLEVETKLTLRLPPRTTVRTAVPTAVRRDYAEFASAYAVRAGVLTASRRLKFLLREIPAARAADYAAFVHAVQNDEAQEFTLERVKATPGPSRPAAPRKPN